MRTALRGVVVTAAVLLGACGEHEERTTTAPAPRPQTAVSSPDPPVQPLPASAAAEVGSLDCLSQTASGLTTSRLPPAPGETRDSASVIVAALRAHHVVPDAADAIDSTKPSFDDRSTTQQIDVAEGVGPAAALDVTATVNPEPNGTRANVVVTRDGRRVVTVTLSESQPGYWALDRLWACSEEVAVSEVDE